MAARYYPQTNMNRGELDPRLVSRTDLQAYYAGLFEATNCQVKPQGGVKKRPGMKFIEALPTTGKVYPFSFNTEQEYLLAFTNARMTIYKGGVKQLNISGSGNDFLTTPWTAAQIVDFDFIQSADTIVITHPDVAVRTITRTSDTAWTITTVTIANIPQFDFDDGSSPTPVNEVQTIDFNNTTEGDRYKLSLNSIITDELIYSSASADGDTTNINTIREALLSLPITGNDGILVTVAVGGVYTVTFSGASAFPFDLIVGTAIRVDQANFAIVAVRTATGTTRQEDVFSAGRGFPITCTFHESRLYFGGSKSRPATIFGSKVNAFFDFDDGIGRDDEGITFTIDTDQVNSIQWILSNTALQIGTTGAEFTVPQILGEPITPLSISVLPQTNLGSKRVRPVSIDGATVFAQETGKSINQFLFSDDRRSNEARSLSILSPQLISNPSQLSLHRGDGVEDANYIYIINDTGNMTVFSTLPSEEVNAFTNWTTFGDIVSVAIVDDLIYTFTERLIDSVTEFHLCKQDSTLQLDAAITGTLSTTTISGLDHLEGETVKVKIDGSLQADATVAAGAITVAVDSGTFEVGLDFNPKIITMPMNQETRNGPNFARKKRIARASVQIFESVGVIVNGQLIPTKTIGSDVFEAPVAETKLFRMGLLGWDLQAQLTITQSTPFPWEILSIHMEIAT